MTPEQWHALTPEQQAWHRQQAAHQAQAQQWAQFQAWQQTQHQQPPVLARPAYNIAAIISLASGLLALLVLPIVLGPAAAISGFVGYSVASRTQGPGSRMSAAGIVLGLIATLLVMTRLGTL